MYLRPLRRRPRDERVYRDGRWYTAYTKTCPGEAGYGIWVGTPTPPAPGHPALSNLADRLHPPPAGLAPPAGQVYVGVGTWFWTDPAAWRPVSVTAWVPTGAGDTTLWATVTATPTVLSFDPGDGSEPVACDGPGDRWTEEDGDEAVSECMYAYAHSSRTAPDGTAFDAALSIVWTVIYIDSSGGTGGLAPITTTTDLPVTVGEIQAIALD